MCDSLSCSVATAWKSKEEATEKFLCCLKFLLPSHQHQPFQAISIPRTNGPQMKGIEFSFLLLRPENITFILCSTTPTYLCSVLWYEKTCRSFRVSSTSLERTFLSAMNFCTIWTAAVESSTCLQIEPTWCQSGMISNTGQRYYKFLSLSTLASNGAKTHTHVARDYWIWLSASLLHSAGIGEHSSYKSFCVRQ